MTTALDTAAAFFAAIESGDVATVELIYAPDAKIWHNTDGQTQSVSENLVVLRWMIRNVSARRYRVIRREAIPGGFIQQHVLEMGTVRGQFELPACIIAEVRHGRIVRRDEYLDSVQVQRMRSVLGV